MQNQQDRIIQLTHDQLKELARETAHETAEQTVMMIKTNIINAVGETVISKMIYFVGAMIFAAYIYLKDHNWLN